MLKMVSVIKSRIQIVYLRILDLIDLSSIELSQFKKKDCVFNIKEAIFDIQQIN